MVEFGNTKPENRKVRYISSVWLQLYQVLISPQGI